ncbi:MAG: helix-turn-helix domain-containing protein [Flavobacteriaceae bacterium]|nr:helix-turn-helix domain-containing protein [Flavobacteriaceae bacterium]
MKDPFIQVYSLSDITQRYPNTLVDQRLAIVDIGPAYKQYFVIGKPYQFTNLGLIVITAGKCQITINLEPITVKRGDIIVVLPNQFFEIIQFSDDFAVKALFVDSSLLLEGSFYFKSNELINILSSKFPKVISLNGQLTREIRFHLKKLKEYSMRNNNLFAKNLVLHHFSVIMYELGNFYYQINLEKNSSKEQRGEEIVKEFLFLMYTHFKQERNVQFYADNMHISRKHLTKIITDKLHKTPKQLIAEAVILEAKVLLKNPKISISEVVTELNFNDTAIFSKYFKTYTGISPTEHKKTY